MPKLKSSKKRLTKSFSQRTRNRSYVSAVRTAVKNVYAAEDAETAQQALKSAVSLIDKTARKGILPFNTAGRTKSRLAARVADMA
ncbi:MAG: 30S ribosomal protein S20 [Gemmatimonadetes bacterium]|nr:30S ribosomal protein S20 [Gemmatimonadota bacterium]